MLNLMSLFSDFLPGYEGISDLIYRGGPALPFIFLTSLVLWALISERIWSLYFLSESVIQPLLKRWQSADRFEDNERKKIRQQLISEAKVSFNLTLDFIKTLVAIAPLLGLLGTIMGMVEIFDVVAVSGSGNVRAMAAGVGQCTLSTMAGLVVALSGLYFINLINRRVEFLMETFSRQMAVNR